LAAGGLNQFDRHVLFGILNCISVSNGSATLAGIAVATLHTMSPEQVSGRSEDIGPASDIAAALKGKLRVWDPGYVWTARFSPEVLCGTR
jgi:hypothetical protein